MKRQNLYTVLWLDDYKQEYDRLEDLDYKQVVYYRQEAKYLHLDISIIKQK